MSDGCPHAGVGNSYNFGWREDEIAVYIEPLCTVGYTAKTLASILLEKVSGLYEGKPGDDATVARKIRKESRCFFSVRSGANDVISFQKTESTLLR